MDPARIAELLSPFLPPSAPSTALEDLSFRAGFSPEESAVLTPSQLGQISTYIDILLRWNARINLTAVRQPDQVVTRHFGESLFAARHLFPSARTKWAEPNNQRPAANVPQLIDVGSGAGFRGLPARSHPLSYIDERRCIRQPRRTLPCPSRCGHPARRRTLRRGPARRGSLGDSIRPPRAPHRRGSNRPRSQAHPWLPLVRPTCDPSFFELRPPDRLIRKLRIKGMRNQEA